MKSRKGAGQPTDELARCIAFARSINLNVELAPGASGFVQGIEIKAGVLRVCPTCLPSTFLHEAGHVATIPRRFRARLSGDIESSFKSIGAEVMSMGLEPDHPLVRAVISAGDPEATAWAWAAGKAIGLDPNGIVLNREYSNTGSAIRLMLTVGRYAGINGLSFGGMCHPARRGASSYPSMIRWTQVE